MSFLIKNPPHKIDKEQMKFMLDEIDRNCYKIFENFKHCGIVNHYDSDVLEQNTQYRIISYLINQLKIKIDEF